MDDYAPMIGYAAAWRAVSMEGVSGMRISRLLAFVLALCMLCVTTASAAYETLRYKDQGSDVRRMQEALTQLGYSTGGTDGKFGDRTLQAVRAFQRDRGLTVDGLAGNQTLTLLYSMAGGSSSGSSGSGSSSGSSGSSGTVTNGCFGGDYSTLKYGARGSRVVTLQKALNQLGYSVGNADGIFGAGTQRAVTQFQRDQGLDDDGLAGRKTLQRIEQMLGSGSTGESSSGSSSSGSSSGSSSSGNTFEGLVIPTRTIRLGSTGEDVKSVQTRLKQLGYYTGSISGECTSSLISAVKAFQQRNGLTADGLAGTNTHKKLFSSSAVAAPSTDGSSSSSEIPTRTMRKGVSGSDVESVSARLVELGYMTSKVSTVNDTMIAAVKAFQKCNGLTADGLAGTNTYKVLYSDSAKAADTSSSGSSGSTTETYRILRKGYTGDDVTRLQKALKELDYKVEVTGVYDTQTIAAVKSFQGLNWLTIDGAAGQQTQQTLYSGNAVKYGSNASVNITPPAKSEIKLLHWVDYIKDRLKTGDQFIVYDPDTGISWRLRAYSRGRHCDSEPVTQADTDAMFAAFGNKNTWTQKAVYVKLPWGEWTIASMHNVPHLSGSIDDNGFDGHLCVHFLRDMSEAEQNDPDYGVSNQKTIRTAWKELTGEDIPYK